MGNNIRVAHLSDLHFSAPLRRGQWNPKRMLARWNWSFVRKRKHSSERLTQAVDSIVQERPDVVLLTGDSTQTGTPQELEAVSAILEPLRQQKIPVLIVDGNHDWYGGSLVHGFDAFCTRFQLDVPVTPSGIATIGDTDILLLHQGCATPPFCAYGRSNPQQLELLRKDLSGRPPRLRLALGHYPLRRKNGRKIPPSHRMWGGKQLATFLEEASITAYFCGHIHHPFVLKGHYGFVQHCSGSSTANTPLSFYEF